MEVPVAGEGRLLRPAALCGADVVLARPSPVPAAGGVYAWYFDPPPPGVPTDSCRVVDGAVLLYVGISPKRPPGNGAPASRQHLRSRIRYHYRGNAFGSTLRLTLGCLLAGQLGIGLWRVGSGRRMTFAGGEAALSGWMAGHARVVWAITERPWELEEHLIRTVALPLNLDQNRHSEFHQQLSLIRAQHRAHARSLPIAFHTGPRTM